MVARMQDMSTVIGLSPLDLGAVRESVDAALRFGGQSRTSKRWDSDGPVGDLGTLDAYHRHADAIALRRMDEAGIQISDEALQLAARMDNERMEAQGLQPRYDAQTLPGRGGLPQDFEAVRARIMEEPYQRLTALELFPIDRGVPVGAQSHRSRRRVGEGEASIYRGRGPIPVVSTGVLDESYGVVDIVCAVETGFFRTLAENFANLRTFEADMRLARHTVMERANRIYWRGDEASNVDGVLNHRSLAKVPLGIDIVNGQTGAAIASRILAVANSPMIVSGGVFSPNALAVSPAIGAYISSNPFNSANSSNVSIQQYILNAQAQVGGISSITIAPELAGVGPSGEDGLFFYRNDLDTLGMVEIQPPTPLPVWRMSPVSTLTVMWTSVGGAVMNDAGNCVLAFATAEQP